MAGSQAESELDAQEEHVKRLTSALADAKSKAMFACGGTLPTELAHATQASAQTVTIRSGPDGAGNTLMLPATGGTTAFEKLLTSCTPASFGKGGEEVHDETYRKATKLDVDAFCTDFSP